MLQTSLYKFTRWQHILTNSWARLLDWNEFRGHLGYEYIACYAPNTLPHSRVLMSLSTFGDPTRPLPVWDSLNWFCWNWFVQPSPPSFLTVTAKGTINGTDWLTYWELYAGVESQTGQGIAYIYQEAIIFQPKLLSAEKSSRLGHTHTMGLIMWI